MCKNKYNESANNDNKKLNELSLSQMKEYGYHWEGMMPLNKEEALQMFDKNLPVYLLYEDNTEALAEEKDLILNHEGIFGIERNA